MITCCRNKLIEKKMETLKKNISCTICKISFQRAEILVKHLEIYHKNSAQKVEKVENPLKCDICQKIFSGQKSLENHGRLCKKRKKFACQNCNSRFEVETRLQIHQENCLKGQDLNKCPKCNAIFKHQAFMFRHCEMYHMSMYAHICSKCNVAVGSKIALNNHEMYCNPLKCIKCNTDFENQDSRILHSKECNGKGNTECHICYQKFGSLNELRSHYHGFHQHSEIHCLICTSRNSYERHQEYNFKCLPCNTLYRNEDSLEWHMRVKHPKYLNEKVRRANHNTISNCNSTTEWKPNHIKENMEIEDSTEKILN